MHVTLQYSNYGHTQPKQRPEDRTEYLFVQNLKAINDLVEPLQATVANPYTILNGLPTTATHFSVVDLKDAFFSVPIPEESRNLFGFEWTDIVTKRTRQYRWTVLPMGFIHSPTIFARMLGSHLDQLPLVPQARLLQYVDDLLVAGEGEIACKTQTYQLLNYLGRWGYRASPAKLQYCLPEVRYLGHVLRQGEKGLASSRVQVIQELVVPKTKRGLCGYLGVTGYCRPWVPAYGEMARILY